MPRYMISFNDGDMQVADDEWEQVAAAAHSVMREAMDAGAWIVGGGFLGFNPHVVAADGSVTSGPLAASPVHIGGFTVVEVADEDEADHWAARIALACRCPQEVRRIMDDPEQEALQRR